MIEIRSATVADVAFASASSRPMPRQCGRWSISPGEGLLRGVQTRLPAARAAPSAYGGDDLFALWQRSRCFLVAEDGHMVVGYLVLYPRQGSAEGWVSHLLVAAGFERSDAVTRLLEGAEAWARRQRLVSITVPTQSRNDPLISS